MDVDQCARREARQDSVQQDVDVAARHQDVAGIDEQDVVLHQPVEDLGRRRLKGRRLHPDARQVGDIGPRRGIDRQDFADTAHGPGQDARRMAGPDLDDVARLALADQRIGDRGIERGKPRLLEQCLAGFQRLGVRIDGIEHGAELVRVLLEQALDRGIGRLRAGRRQQRRVAMRNEPAARLQPENGRQSQRKPPPAAAQAGRGTHRYMLTALGSGLHGRRARAADRPAQNPAARQPPRAPRCP